MINVHNGIREKGINPINIDNYPVLKNHLDNFYYELEKRSDKGVTPYNLRNCAYMEDFYKQKIIYPDIMRMPANPEHLETYPYFYLDKQNFFVEATNFMMTGSGINQIYLFMTSNIGFFAFSKFYTGPQFDATGFRFKKAYLDRMYIPILEESQIHRLQGFLEDIDNNINISQRNDAFWSEILNLSEDEMEIIINYKEKLLASSFNESNFLRG